MKIHIKSSSERISDIANYYGMDEYTLRIINGLENSDCANGEELLILTPTRSYTVKQGDTLERINLRFGIGSNDILTFNPWIKNKELADGQRLALKYGDRRWGMAVANGYFYKGCSIGAFMQAMPYLTYVTFAGGVADKTEVKYSAIFDREVKMAKENKKIPLLRIYDRFFNRYKRPENNTHFAENIIQLAIDGGYKGVVLNSCPLNNSAEDFSKFLMILRKLMIGCDLILITEINEYSPVEFSEYADGSIMYYPKYAMENPPTFDEGEGRVLSDFACHAESAKTFVDLPCLARCGNDFINTGEALRYARISGAAIENNKSTLLSRIPNKKQGDYIFSSLANIKATLELVGELDYMGICFDIMRTPLSYLMMYNAMFKTSYYNSVRTREGCNHAGED